MKGKREHWIGNASLRDQCSLYFPDMLQHVRYLRGDPTGSQGLVGTLCLSLVWTLGRLRGGVEGAVGRGGLGGSGGGECVVAIWWTRCRIAAFSAWENAPEPIWNGSLRWFHQWHETLTKGLPMRDSLGLCLRSGTLCHSEAHYPCSC